MKNKTNWPLRPEPGNNPLVYIGWNTLDELVDVCRIPEMDPSTPPIAVILRTVREIAVILRTVREQANEDVDQKVF